MVRGTRGYAENAEELIARYESIAFPEKHQAVLSLIPAAPCRVLEVGAGPGADAHWLASRGYRVTAVEPTEVFRSHAQARYPSPPVEWVDDALPELATVVKRQRTFDLILLTAVWMHLDRPERALAMPVLASLLADARRCGLSLLLDARALSAHRANRQAGVTWSQVAFARPREMRASA
jgi:2-polyprenyl-3-methyl-5-hydroxy-6-metoxy-1,4-benzoquinol methylase